MDAKDVSIWLLIFMVLVLSGYMLYSYFQPEEAIIEPVSTQTNTTCDIAFGDVVNVTSGFYEGMSGIAYQPTSDGMILCLDNACNKQLTISNQYLNGGC